MSDKLEWFFAVCIVALWHVLTWAFMLLLLIVCIIGFPYFYYARRKEDKEQKMEKEEADNKFKTWKELPR
jgi:flagellar biosynthesis protein FlhB